MPPPVEATGDKPQLAADLFYSLIKGETHYVQAAPVLTLTTFSFTKPETGRIGRGTRTTEKPHPDAPEGYEWLKTLDDKNQDAPRGQWQRVQVWEAADSWNPKHYDLPASP